MKNGVKACTMPLNVAFLVGEKTNNERGIWTPDIWIMIPTF
jgi:hypothetical protein